MGKKKAYIILFLTPTILLFLLVYGASLVLLLGSSFTEWRIGSKAVFNGLANYIKLFGSDSDFLDSFKNTAVWILLQSTIHVAIGVTLALILSMKEFYWKFVRTVYMIPNIISSAALGMLFLCILNPEFGAVNTFVRALGNKEFYHNWFMEYSTAFMAVTMTWLPFAAIVTILVLAEMASIPESLFESARIDGANNLEINLHIVFPLLRNIIGTCVILGATSMLQKLDIIMMTTGGGPGNITMNLPMYIYKTALVDNNFAYANTVGVFLVSFGIAIVLLIQRLFRIGTSDI